MPNTTPTDEAPDVGSRKCNVHLAIRTHSRMNQPRQASPHRNSKGDGNGGDDGTARGTPKLNCDRPSGKANRLPCIRFKQDSCQKGNFCNCWHILECRMQISTGMQVRRQSVFYCWTYSAIVGSLNFRIVSSSSGTNSFLLIRWSEALESTMSFLSFEVLIWDEMRWEALNRGWAADCDHMSSVTGIFAHRSANQSLLLGSIGPRQVLTKLHNSNHHYEAELSQTVTLMIFVTVFNQVFSWKDVFSWEVKKHCSLNWRRNSMCQWFGHVSSSSIIERITVEPSLGESCEENGFSQEWHPCQPSYLIKNGRRIECETDNHISWWSQPTGSRHKLWTTTSDVWKQNYQKGFSHLREDWRGDLEVLPTYLQLTRSYHFQHFFPRIFQQKLLRTEQDESTICSFFFPRPELRSMQTHKSCESAMQRNCWRSGWQTLNRRQFWRCENIRPQGSQWWARVENASHIFCGCARFGNSMDSQFSLQKPNQLRRRCEVCERSILTPRQIRNPFTQTTQWSLSELAKNWLGIMRYLLWTDPKQTALQNEHHD